MVPIYKINALRLLTAGNAKEHFESWEADRKHTEAAKSYEELLISARTRKLDAPPVHKNMPHGSGPIDVGAVHDEWEGDIDAAGLYRHHGKATGRSHVKGSGFDCGSNCFVRECPYLE